tara:strand:+ start:3521 stop:4201 length:681 start_codon:yes stop_codon:yes gene_type:complete
MKDNILIIGGFGDIGSSISKKFSETYQVTSTSRDELDLSSKKSISNFLKVNKKKFKHIIFCAAENYPNYFKEMKYEEIYNSIQVNLLSITEILHFYYTNNMISNHGTITIISSIYSYLGKIKRFPYSVSKHALNGLVKNLAIEMSHENIRVNSVTPGFIDTKLTRRNLSDEEILEIKKTIPCGDLGAVDDIANVVTFISSDYAKYINGQDIIVDGGFLCGGFLGLE